MMSQVTDPETGVPIYGTAPTTSGWEEIRTRDYLLAFDGRILEIFYKIHFQVDSGARLIDALAAQLEKPHESQRFHLQNLGL